MSYENPWLYQGEIFDPDEKKLASWHGFVYIIICPDNTKYIGRKTFWFMRKNRGAKRRSKIESDWKNYYGSNQSIIDEVKANGTEGFQRIILSLHKTKGEMNYTEIKEQFNRGVLESDEFRNININGKYFKNLVRKWYENK
jgi:hypothetical protein